MVEQSSNLDQQFNQTQEQTTPSTVTPPPPYYPQAVFPAPEPKPKGNLIKIIIGTILLVILGTGTTLATRVWDPLWNPFRPSAEKVIAKMADRMKEVKTMHIRMDFGIGIKNGLAADIAMKIETDSDTSDLNNLKSTGNLSLVFAQEGTQLSMALETRAIGQDSYIKLTTIPASPALTPYLQMMGIEPEQFKNQWIKLDETSLPELLGESNYGGLIREQEERQKQEEAMLEKFKKLFENKKVYLMDKELPDEEINGTKTYHYIVSLDKEEIKKIIPEMFNVLNENLGENVGLLPGLSKNLDSFFEKVGALSGELWIGKKDNLLYRFKGEKTFDLSKFESNAIGTISLKIDVDLSKFNQPVNVEAPSQYKNLKEILSPILGEYDEHLSETQTRAKDARIAEESDLLQASLLNGILEIFRK